MKKFYIPISKRAQLPPGSAVYTGERSDRPVNLLLLRYNEQTLDEMEPTSADACLELFSESATNWLNVDGLCDEETVKKLGKQVPLHDLTIEDILHPHQRPRMEELDQALFLVMRMLYLSDNQKEIRSEQISFILYKNRLITFQECQGDVFDPIRQRLRQGQGRVRQKGTDYLLYALMDSIVDHYYQVLEHMGEAIEAIEAAVMQNPESALLNQLYTLKRELLYLRKSVWPLRDTVNLLERSDHPLISPKNQPYFRDLYDHTIQVIDTVESFRDMLSSVQDLYHSSQGTKTNEVMKVLTIISTIFIPITFIAGIYGMNFDIMPELHWKYGYPAVWILMLLTIGAMLLFFRKKKWF
jgi:magnesium transporter